MIIYCGIPVLITGLLGGILNTMVFLSLKTFRQSSCAFYLTILSIVNIAQLITGLFTRIMISGFGIDWTQVSLFYCKFRTFIFQTATTISFTCICLATIDQYLATCTRRQWQQWSNIKIARRIMIIAILIAFIEQIPCLIFYDLVKSPGTNISTCTITSDSFVQFNTYFNHLILGNIIPYLITFSFGLMAYHNIQEIAYRTVPLVRRELDKQITVMVLVQVVLNFFTIVPFIIVNTLAFNTSILQDPVIVARVQIVGSVTVCLYYLFFAVIYRYVFFLIFSSFDIESILYLYLCI
jgi:hypothetical protein